MEKIDRLDKKILSILSKNARMPFKDVAAECNVSRAAIHQRVQHLTEDGVITGSKFDVDPKSLGFSTCTYVGITLQKGSMYKAVVEQLEHIPEIVECHFTTGPYTMLVKLYAKGQRTAHGPAQQPDAGDSGSGVYRDAHLSGTEHQERDSYRTERSRRGGTSQKSQGSIC